MVFLFMVVVYLLEVEFFGRDQDNSRKYTHCNRTNHTIDQCWELHGKPSWPPHVVYLSNTVGSSTAYDSNTLNTFADESMTLSEFECDFLIQKMHSDSTQTLLP